VEVKTDAKEKVQAKPMTERAKSKLHLKRFAASTSGLTN
jgi:hypothetical protein